MRRARIVVADCLPIFRTGVRNVLLRESDFDVIDVATVDETERIAANGDADIALIDLELPHTGGIDAAARLAVSPTKTIVWSFTPTRSTVVAAIRAGANGYLHKEISANGLVRALRGVVAGEAPLSRDLAALMIEGLHGLEQQATARERASVLSLRERQVLRLVADGARNKQIAVQLAISEFTVKRHIHNILQKLSLPSRYAAARFYRDAFQPEAVTSVGGQTA